MFGLSLSLLDAATAALACAMALLTLRSSEVVLPRSAACGFNGFPKAWSRLRWPLLRRSVAAFDTLVLLGWWFGAGTARGEAVFALQGVLLWKLAFLACALGPWLLLLGLAHAPRQRLRLALNREALKDLRRFERTAAGLWLFRGAIGLRLAGLKWAAGMALAGSTIAG